MLHIQNVQSRGGSRIGKPGESTLGRFSLLVGQTNRTHSGVRGRVILLPGRPFTLTHIHEVCTKFNEGYTLHRMANYGMPPGIDRFGLHKRVTRDNRHECPRIRFRDHHALCAKDIVSYATIGSLRMTDDLLRSLILLTNWGEAARSVLHDGDRPVHSLGAKSLHYVDAPARCRGSHDATTAAASSTNAERTTANARHLHPRNSWRQTRYQEPECRACEDARPTITAPSAMTPFRRCRGCDPSASGCRIRGPRADENASTPARQPTQWPTRRREHAEHQGVQPVRREHSAGRLKSGSVLNGLVTDMPE